MKKNLPPRFNQNWASFPFDFVEYTSPSHNTDDTNMTSSHFGMKLSHVDPLIGLSDKKAGEIFQ